MKIWFTLALVVLADASGNLLLARGMRQMGQVAPRLFTNPLLILGIGCMSVSFFSFLALLSWANLSFVLPATAVGYVANTCGAAFLLRERVTPARWMGTLLIGVGVFLVSLTPVSF